MNLPKVAKGSIPTLPSRWARGDVGRAIGAWIEASIKQALAENGINGGKIDGSRVVGTVSQGAAKLTAQQDGVVEGSPASIFNFEAPLTVDYVTSPSIRFNVSWAADLEDLDNVVITSIADGDVLTWDAGSSQWINTAPSGGSSGTVTSVALTAPTQFAVTGSPITTSGTLALAWNTQTANRVLAGPTSGGAAAPTFRALVAADLPAIALDDLSDVVITSPATGAVLKYDGANWIDDTDTGFANPMTTQDDIIIGGASGVPTRMAKGSDSQVLTVDPSTHHLVWSTPAAAITTNQKRAEIVFALGDGTNAITTAELDQWVSVNFDGTIEGWDLLADASGSISIDVWKDTYANYPPTVADTITGANYPALSSATKNQDGTLTSWTGQAITRGDVIQIHVRSASTVKRVVFVLKVVKT